MHWHIKTVKQAKATSQYMAITEHQATKLAILLYLLIS